MRAPFTDDELEQWAKVRADDAGHLARKLITYRRAAPSPASQMAGLTISAAEARALLHGMPAYDFSAALTRIANCLAEYDETPTPLGNQIRRAECVGKDAVPMTGQLPVGTASTTAHLVNSENGIACSQGAHRDASGPPVALNPRSVGVGGFEPKHPREQAAEKHSDNQNCVCRSHITTAEELLNLLREAEPYIEICHSLMTRKDTRENAWRVLKLARSALASATSEDQQ